MSGNYAHASDTRRYSPQMPGNEAKHNSCSTSTLFVPHQSQLHRNRAVLHCSNPEHCFLICIYMADLICNHYIKQVQECVLTLNVQVLAKAPLSWRVSLVDTPGFGENNPVTTQVADRALKSSSAHLYVVNMGSLNSTVDAKYYRELEDKDQGRHYRIPL